MSYKLDARYSESRLVTDGTGWAFTNYDITKDKDMEAGDLVRNKSTNEMGVIQWADNQYSWWHRKKGMTAITILLTKSGKTAWWKLKEIEVVSKSGH